MDIFKDIDLFGDSRWKNTPAGPVLDTGIGDLIIEKVLEETGNVKTKDVFNKLRKARNWLDDNILAH